MDNYPFMAKLWVNRIISTLLQIAISGVSIDEIKSETQAGMSLFLLFYFLLLRYGTNSWNTYVAVGVMATYKSSNRGDLKNVANQHLARVANQRLVYYIDYYDALMRTCARTEVTPSLESSLQNKKKFLIKLCYLKTT